MKGVTSDHDLHALCTRLNVTVDGILLLEEFTKLKNKNGTYITLLGQSSVGHWVVYDTNYYFDSNGLLPFKEIKAMKPKREAIPRRIWSIMWSVLRFVRILQTEE